MCESSRQQRATCGWQMSYDDLARGMREIGMGMYKKGDNEVEVMNKLVCRPAGFSTWACREVTKLISNKTPVPPGFHVETRSAYKYRTPGYGWYTRRCQVSAKYADKCARTFTESQRKPYMVLIGKGGEYLQCLMPWVIYSREPDCDHTKLPWLKKRADTPKSAVTRTIRKRR